ncbi:MAG: DUF6596 domain-containing protein [Bryobacteraceae bacterium]
MPGSATVEHLFRHRAGQMLATLIRMFGAARIDLIEDAIQDSLLRAVKLWPLEGEPSNPTAWLIQVARNALLDKLRRLSREGEWQAAEKAAGVGEGSAALFAHELRDDQLRLIFACCHPAISRDAQVAVTLKTVGGFSTREIARAYLAPEATVAQRIVRAKARLRSDPAMVAVPPPPELPIRLDAVLEALYLMFNEGYSALDGEHLVRVDLCAEAIRLVELLAGHPLTAHPRVHAMAALFYFHAARLPARSDAAGELLLLADQDRSLWNQSALAHALRHLERSAQGDEVSTYHLEAEIASCHTVARDWESTDWAHVLACYDELLARSGSPVVALNRVVALAQVEGAECALRELDRLDAAALTQYYPYHATRGELLRLAGDTGGARAALDQGLRLASSAPVRRFLTRRMEILGFQSLK